MDRLICAVLCGFLAFAHSTDVNQRQLSQQAKEVTNDNASSQLNKPLSYSSVVYFQNDQCIFCTGVLIAPKYVFTDGYCGDQVLSLSQIKNKADANDFLASRTLVWFEKFNMDLEIECEFNDVWEVHFEEREDISTDDKYNLFAVVELAIEVELSNSISLAYLPKAAEMFIFNKIVTAVELNERGQFKLVNLVIKYVSRDSLEAELKPNNTHLNNILVGSPLFHGRSLVGLGSIHPKINEGSISHFKKIFHSYNFVCKFASCKVFDESLNDPGCNLVEEETSSSLLDHEQDRLV